MKMGMQRRGVLAVCALVLLAACSSGGDDPPPPPPTTGALTVVNHHCVPIDALYLVPSSSADWGANQLSASVAPDGNFTISNVPPGQYDVQAIGADGLYWESSGATAIVITAGTTYPWPLYMPEGTGCLEVLNGSGYTIGAVFYSPNGCAYGGTWGDNQLVGTIPPTHSVVFSSIPAGYYDLAADEAVFSWDTCAVGPAYIAAGETYVWPLGN